MAELYGSNNEAYFQKSASAGARPLQLPKLAEYGNKHVSNVDSVKNGPQRQRINIEKLTP
jgi:hypothetical protein